MSLPYTLPSLGYSDAGYGCSYVGQTKQFLEVWSRKKNKKTKKNRHNSRSQMCMGVIHLPYILTFLLCAVFNFYSVRIVIAQLYLICFVLSSFVFLCTLYVYAGPVCKPTPCVDTYIFEPLLR